MNEPFAPVIAAGRNAQRAWSERSVRDRLRPVRELRHRLVERADELIAAVQSDIGRSPQEVLATELLPSASALKFQEKEAPLLLAPQRVPLRLRPTWLFGCRDIVHHRPWGVIGIIGTWNYPIFLNVGPIAAALTAGNCVLWKPSEHAPRTAEVTHRLFLEAGFPPDLLVRLPATREAGLQVAEASIDYVVFTGSEQVGRTLAARLGERLIPSTLELSGCDPMFVLADANVKRAAQAAFFGFTLNHGQTCIAVRRIFVHRSRVAEFSNALKQFVVNGTTVSLVTPGQREQARRLIVDAVQRGATAFPPGTTDTGTSQNGQAITVLFDCPAEAAVCRESSFAPICAVIPFDTIDAALSGASKCLFGLSASVFSGDVRAAQDCARRIPAGSVVINDTIAPTAHPATSFGGRGASGWGVTQGADGLLAMTVSQVVSVRHGPFAPHIEEAVNPDPDATAGILRGLLRASHARSWRARLGGVRQLFSGVRRRR